MSAERIETGKKGESLAQSFLKRSGYKIIEKNYKTRFGEIDIIGKDRGYVSFIEVRSVNTERFGLPEETIDRKKQLQVTKVALSYIKKYQLEDTPCRFDVVCIEDVNNSSPKIKLIKNAFELELEYRY